MDPLSELISVANAALSGRTQTERSNKVDRMTQLLSQEPILRALDANAEKKADSRNRQLFSWDNLFNLAKNIFENEIESQKSLKGDITAATAARREKKKRELFKLVKDIVKCADRRGRRNLRAGDVVEFVLSSLGDTFLCAHFGVDLSTLLVKDILAVRQYWSNLPSKLWLELLTKYCKLLQSPPRQFDRYVLVRVIRVVSDGASQQCDMRGKILLPLLSRYFLNIRDERRMKVKEEMVATLLVVSRSLAVNGRVQVCRLGEQLMTSLINMWSTSPSDSLIDYLIEFLDLQLMAHHPRGARTEDTGAYAVDWNSWKSDIKRLYEAVIDDLHERTGRTKFSSSSLMSFSCRLKENYVKFAVRLFHQVFVEGQTSLDVTQLATQAGNAPKRRRVQTGWGMLEDVVSQHQNSRAVPWLQILQALLEEHPTSLPEEDGSKILSILHTVLIDTKQRDTLALCLASLASVATSHNSNRQVWTKDTITQCEVIWNKVWAATIRCLSLHQAEEEAFHLLSSLVSYHIVTPDNSLWMIFLPNLSPVSNHAIKFLEIYLQHADLPSRYRPSVMISTDANVQPTNSINLLRYQLIDWLFPANRECDVQEAQTSRTFSDIRQISPVILSRLVIALTLRDPRSIKTAGQSNKSSSTNTPPLQQDIEKLYLQLTFDLPLDLPGSEGEPKVIEDKPCKNKGHLSSMFQHVLKVIGRESERLNSNPTTNYETAEEAFWWCGVLSNLLALMLHHSFIVQDELSSHPILRLLQKAFERGTNAFAQAQGDEKASPERALNSLLSLLRNQEDSGPVSVATKVASKEGSHQENTSGDGHIQAHLTGTGIALYTVPPQLVDTLLTMVLSNPGNVTIAGDQHDRSDTDLFGSDDEMDTAPASSTTVNEDDDFDLMPGMGQGSQDDDERTSNIQANNCESLLSPSLLTDSQRHRILAMRILSLWSRMDPTNRSLSGLKSAVDSTRVMDELISLLDEERKWDPQKSYHLQLLQTLAQEFCSPSSYLRSADCESLTRALWFVGKAHRRDQDICCTVLMLTSQLVPQLAKCNATDESIDEARYTCIRLVTAFRKHPEINQFSYWTRVALASCMSSLLQADAEGEWEKHQGRGDASSHLDHFPALLQDKNPAIRLLAVAKIHSLFTNENESGSFPKPREKQNAMFDKIYILVSKIMTVEGQLSEDEITDESANRTASLLHTLAALTTASAICEKKSLFAFYQVTQENTIEKDLVIKILEQVSRQLNYPDLKAFTAVHLPFVLTQWLDNEYSLEQFPFQLCGYTTLRDFYANHYKLLVPVLLTEQVPGGPASVAKQLHVSEKDLLKHCLPHTLVLILPKFAMADAQPSQKEPEPRHSHQIATAVYDTIEKAIGKEAIEECIVNKLDEIVVQILMCLYLPSKRTENNNLNMLEAPEPNPPCYSRKVIVATLDYLVANNSSSATSIVGLLSKSQDGIQSVLLSLHEAMWSAGRIYEQRRILYMYQLFVKLLLQEFESGLAGNSSFVLRDVIYTLLYVVENRLNNSSWTTLEEDVTCSCLDLLHEVFSKSISCSYNELGRLLPFITSTLLPHSGSNTKIGQKCLSRLEFLLVEHKAELADFIKFLPPPPETEKLQRFHAAHRNIKYRDGPLPLIKEIKYFLSGRSSSPAASRGSVEALQFLRQKLEQHKEELKIIVRNSNDAAYSATNNSSNILVQLLSELLALLRCKKDLVAKETSRLLGEIGPVALDVVSMAPPPHPPELQAALERYSDNPKSQQYCHILHMLDQYLTDPNISVVTAASGVLKKVLSTKVGLDFFTDYNKQLDNALMFLHPFKAPKRKVVMPSDQNRSDQKFVETLDSEGIWSASNSNHEGWIMSLVRSIINSGSLHDPVFMMLTPICDVKVEMCEVILPFLLHDVLKNGTDVHRDVLSRQIQNFFNQHCKQTGQSDSANWNQSASSSSRGDVFLDVKSVRVMLNVIQYLRIQERPVQGNKKQTAWDRNWWLDLDYLSLAQAASNCSSYFTTLLFAEIWCDAQRAKREEEVHEQGESQGISHSQGRLAGGDLSDLTSNSNLPSHPDINVQELMLQAYRCLGDQDGVYGCGAGKLADKKSRIQTYEHENNWSKAVGSYDIQLSLTSSYSDQVGILKALQKFGAGHVLEKYIQGLTTCGLDESSLRDFQYEAAWRNNTWDLSTPTRLEEPVDFHESIYTSLYAVRHRDHPMLTSALDHTRDVVVSKARTENLKIMSCVFPVMAQLHCLTQLEYAAKMVHSDPGPNIPALEKLWEDHNSILSQDFDILEEPLLQRCRLLQQLKQSQPLQGGRRVDDNDINQAMTSQLVWFAQQARQANRLQVAERALLELQHMTREGNLESMLPWKLEEAQLYWSRGETDSAKHLMKRLIKTLSEKHEDHHLFPKCLDLYGNWLAETKSENPKVILEEFLIPAAEITEKQKLTSASAVEAYLSLARYTDAQYQMIVDHMNSPTFEAKRNLMKQAKADAEDLRKMGERSSRYLRTLDLQSVIDETELLTMQRDRENYLSFAMQNYVKCLQLGDGHDLRIFRLTSLWFSNKENAKINRLIKAASGRIKSYKFLPLMYQLAARMGCASLGSSNTFLSTLEHVIERTVKDHPHHSLSVILALAHAHKDEEFGAGGSASSRRGGKVTQSKNAASDQDRVKAAKEMVSRLKSTSRAQLVSDMESLSIMYIELANMNVDQYKRETKPIKFPSKVQLIRVSELSTVAVPTVETKVDPTCEYKDIVYVNRFEKTFKLAGGINLPKIITCIGSDGGPRRQLVKGKDDLRQDAVMQQVFGMVNHLLKQDKNTKARKLLIRRYKVIPLSQRSGLLEWCEGTMPFGEYLIGSKGAHQRYRHKDITARECREKLTGSKTGKDKRYEAYTEVCKSFQPVFRYFFMEKFPDPTSWYERRIAYTRSVATNSIVGYILGLGDRHVQNILIDCNSAELVHIDLGVAFEQGKILPTPETVPFRLTRDVVDGMGVTGVEGTFRRCCECTMEVLRGSGEALLTILTVLLYDPLNDWTISPLKAYALQSRRENRNDTEPTDPNQTANDILALAERGSSPVVNATDKNVNQLAERVLLRLKQKLDGVEQGVHLSVSGHVNLLIQEATDPHNLCKLFPGWQPYI